ncbi:DUF1090 domain-containing protein (plasmid) [Klebsiella sp. BDA134-6]|uniref:DUF1090 domain-containing protein n=1 Tax=Klebsiella sp. BDA134-6 TaxID=2787706 RepID=UPI0018A0D3D6|nr:DUF1090 domain-containing protein [Klebsiella sp. BDA134-6]QPF30598.1 DUF1090 domain-containing protein [Klebsiella sp. BDA134-6]
MKSCKTILVGLLILTPVLSVQAATGCEAKRLNIEQQLDYARANGNKHRIAGLEKALSELNTNCTDEGLRAERESKVKDKELKLEKRRQELAEAQANGRADKVAKKQHKLEEAQIELDEARSMVNK